MKTSIIASIIGAAVLVAAQASTPDLPQCANDCAMKAMTTITGCTPGDFPCYCKNDQFISTVSTCLGTACTSEKDRNAAIEAAKTICGSSFPSSAVASLTGAPTGSPTGNATGGSGSYGGNATKTAGPGSGSSTGGSASASSTSGGSAGLVPGGFVVAAIFAGLLTLYRRPGSSNSGESRRHSHRHSRSRSRHSRHSRKGSRSRRSSPSDDERSRSRVREYTDKIKDHRKEIGASLLGAAAGGAIGQKLGGGGIGTILGVAAGAFAGDKLEKHHERRKSGRKSRDEDDNLAYGSKYGASQRDLAPSDSDDEQRRHRHHHHHRRSRSRRGHGSDSD